MERSNWQLMKLEDFVSVQRGYDLPESQRRSGNIPVIGSAGINGYHDTARAKAPGVTIGRSGASIGVVTYSSIAYFPHNACLFVTDFHGNDERFAYYLLQTIDFKSYNSGSAQPSLNRNYIYQIDIKVPPLSTQKRVANILSTYDRLIENNTRRIKILEEMAQLLYREWFVNFRFPGHQQVSMIESVIGLIPKGWEVKTLADMTAYINRGIAPKYDEQSKRIVINQKCIRNGRLNLELARRHNKTVPLEKFIQFGDVLINSTGIGTLGRVTQIYQNLTDCTVDSHVSIVRPSELVNKDFFGLALLQLQQYFDQMGVGSTGQTELSRQAIANTSFLVPPKQLQDSFSQYVSPMRQLIIAMDAKMLICVRPAIYCYLSSSLVKLM